MIINPFATLNDGLVDITWVHDDRVAGLLGISDLLGKAKNGGV